MLSGLFTYQQNFWKLSEFLIFIVCEFYQFSIRCYLCFCCSKWHARGKFWGALSDFGLLVPTLFPVYFCGVHLVCARVSSLFHSLQSFIFWKTHKTSVSRLDLYYLQLQVHYYYFQRFISMDFYYFVYYFQ